MNTRNTSFAWANRLGIIAVMTGFLIMGTSSLQAQILSKPTEFFFGPFDLQNKQIIFSPFEDPSNPGTFLYGVTLKDITELPVEDLGKVINLSRLDFRGEVELEESPFPFYGVNYDTINFQSHATLNFGSSVLDFTPSELEHRSRSQIAVFWTDLNAGGEGAVYFNTTDDAYVFTWSEVSSTFNPAQKVTVQAELKFDGRIILSYTNVTIIEPFFGAVVGISDGSAIPSDFINFSAAPENIVPQDIILTGSDVDENLNAETLIANLVALDSDFGDTHTYDIIPGVGDTHNRFFYIKNGNRLVTTQPIDFEKDPALFLRLRVRDSFGNLFETTKTITVNDQLIENSDGDALLDIEEVFLGTNPLDASDSKPMYDFISASEPIQDSDPISTSSADSGQGGLVVQYQRSSSQDRIYAVEMWSRDLKTWQTTETPDPSGVKVIIHKKVIQSGDPETVQAELEVVNGSTNSLFFKQLLYDLHNL